MREGVHNNKFSVHAIAGTHVITLAFDAKNKDAAKGLMGFAIFRTKFGKDNKPMGPGSWQLGFKPFEAVVANPQPKVKYPTNEHPWQSFVWADFAVEQGKSYEYKVHPVTGTPGNLNLQEPLIIKMAPEKANHKLHEIYFNRGASASQAYAERFDNKKPSDKTLTKKEKQERYDWLSRGLFEAVAAYIRKAKNKNYGLRAAIYELDYPQIPMLFKEVLDKGADVQIVYEARKGESQTKQNQDALKAAGFKINDKKITYARSKSDGIPHNKFMVLIEKKAGKEIPLMVWTGSTNLSEGGIFGHSNLGHCIKDADVAAQYLEYWKMLKANPTKAALIEKVTKRWPNIEAKDFPKDKMTVIFSPRKGTKMLNAYADVYGSADRFATITLPFNLDACFQDKLNEEVNAVRYVMLNSGKTNVAIADKFNPDADVIIAPGSKFDDQWGQWLNEIHTGFNGSNVLYIHTKFLLKDPLGENPVVITGSANFSQPSTNKNDENMVYIPCSTKKGETRVQDIYLGEFFRLFDHLYFRYLAAGDHRPEAEKRKQRFLKPTSQEWVDPYFNPGTDRFKRRENFSFGFK